MDGRRQREGGFCFEVEKRVTREECRNGRATARKVEVEGEEREEEEVSIRGGKELFSTFVLDDENDGKGRRDLGGRLT